MKIIPCVVIPKDKFFYIYPKVAKGNQKLLKLDRIGLLMYELISKKDTDDEVIEGICKQFDIEKPEDYEKVRLDFLKFKAKLIEAELIEGDNVTSSRIKSNLNRMDEWKYISELEKLQNSFSLNDTPYKFFIELTYNCNLRCAHCYRGEDINSDGNFLKKEVVFRTIDAIEEIGAVEVIFTGGECFTHPDIYEILDYACSKNLIVTVLTNGNYINKNIIDRIKDMPIYDFRISIYGMNEKHDALTKVIGSWEKSVNALEILKEEMGIGTAVYVVTNDNIEDFEYVYSYFRKKNIKLSINSLITPTAKGSLEPTGMRIHIDDYGKIMQKYMLPITGSKCTAGISRMRISPDGDVNPCELISGHSFGNLYKSDLKEIIESKERKEFLKYFKSLLAEHICTKKCEKKEICNFCPGIFLLENNNINQPAEYLCHMTGIKEKVLSKRIQENKKHGEML